MDKTTIRKLAQMNLRGICNPSLLAILQEAKDKIDILVKHPDCCMDIVPYIPSDFLGTREEYLEMEIYHYTCVKDAIIGEFKRRHKLNSHITESQSFDKELIEVIKERIPVEDVLEWYTHVFIPKGCYQKNWTFRCTLHGPDKHPSGVIYPQEDRWWCFVCNTGGDIFEAVKAFEKVCFSEAVAKLARYIGLDTKPIFPEQKPKIIGGIPV